MNSYVDLTCNGILEYPSLWWRTKEIPRPDIADFLFCFLPIIDNHNKSRQHHLALEQSWQTRNCWFRLLTTLIGMSVVDLYRLYRFYDYEKWSEFSINQFADTVSAGLVERNRRILPVPLRRQLNTNPGNAKKPLLKRYTGKRMGDDDIRKQLTKKQKQSGRHSRHLGSSKQACCWVCRKYKANYVYTQWTCVACNTPICFHTKQFDEEERDGWKTCLEEHLNSGCEKMRCSGFMKGHFPKDLAVFKRWIQK